MWGRHGFDGDVEALVACRAFSGQRVKKTGKTQMPTTTLSWLSLPKNS
jgi:hypothetical protein